MKKCLGLAFLILVLVHYGASAPRQSDAGDAAGNPKKSGSQKASVSPQGFMADQILKFFGHKTGKELMEEKKNKESEVQWTLSKGGGGASGVPGLAAKSMAPAVSTIKAPARAVPIAPAQSKGAMVVPTSPISNVQEIKKLATIVPPPASPIVVPQVRQEIQNIFALNKKIQTVQSGSSAQLQRIQEQARIHQEILNQLETSAQNPESVKKVSSKEALLAQEKLRIIHEETQRNNMIIEDLKAAPAKASANKTSGNVPPSDFENTSEGGPQSDFES